jgi:pimeloyl-ACP methyl ester carboxylesterase
VETLLHALLWVFAILFLVALHVRFWRARYRLLLAADATYYARTDDGWRLALHRYRGGGGEPVLLCHGLGANAYNMDLGPRLSLARFLAERNFDVWVLELRGAGLSRSRDATREAGSSWSFDDHVHRDVPAAIALVLAETGQERLHWVGHSYGGMVAYAYLGLRLDSRIASLCTVGSPAGFLGHSRLRLVWPVLYVLGLFPTLRTRAFAGAGIPFYIGLPLSYMTHHGRNITARDVRRAMANLVEPISSKTLRHLSRWLRTRQFTSYDGRTDYLALMRRVTTPTFLLAGAGDALAPPETVRAGFDSLGASQKELVVLGREQGTEHDYGHGDLLIGYRAAEEVYPRIASWLNDRRTGRARAAGRVAAVLASGRRKALTFVGDELTAGTTPSAGHPAVADARRAPSTEHPVAHARTTDPEGFAAASPALDATIRTSINPYDPFARRRRERWVHRGGRTPLEVLAPPEPAARGARSR